MAAASTVAFIGIFLAWSWYAKGKGSAPHHLAERFPGVYRTLVGKYFVDEAYEKVFVRGIALGGGRALWDVDANLVDLIPNGAAGVTRGASWAAALFDQYVVDGLVNGFANTMAGSSSSSGERRPGASRTTRSSWAAGSSASSRCI